MGKRARRQGRAEKLAVPTSTYREDDRALELRGVLTARTRAEYADVLAGGGRPAATQEDAWQRAVEFLFERLAVSWELGGVAYRGQKELLLRFRAASPDERASVRRALREHLAEHFPEVQAP